MTLHRTDAIILKRDRQGETSLLVDVFLASDGRTRLLAKGARKPGSTMVGKLEPFAEVELLYYRKNEDNLGVISQVNQFRNNNDLGGDIRRLSYASAVVEALESMTLPGEKQKQVYELVKKTFYMLNYCQPRKLDFFFLAFLLKLLDLLGLAPELVNCVKSGKEITSEEILFSVEEGGVIDEDKTDPQKGYLRLDRGLLRIMGDVRNAEIDKLKNLNLSDKQKNVFRDLIFSFISYHTEGKPSFNSLNFLSRIGNS